MSRPAEEELTRLQTTERTEAKAQAPGWRDVRAQRKTLTEASGPPSGPADSRPPPGILTLSSSCGSEASVTRHLLVELLRVLW